MMCEEKHESVSARSVETGDFPPFFSHLRSIRPLSENQIFLWAHGSAVVLACRLIGGRELSLLVSSSFCFAYLMCSFLSGLVTLRDVFEMIG
jgi:hypothetical protein